MDQAISFWPVCFIGFWAYPFIAIPHFRRRRAAMDLARMVFDDRVETIEQAISVISVFRMQVLADSAALSQHERSQTEG